jgi:hypothetical protein
MPNSTSEAVGTTAKAIVDAIGITYNSVAIPSVKRKTPTVPEGTSLALPQIVISVGAEGRTEYLTGVQKLKIYPVAATIVSNTGQQAGDDAVIRQWRQQIELALEGRSGWQTGANAISGWNRATIVNQAPFDLSTLSKDYNYAVVIVEVEVLETRGT